MTEQNKTDVEAARSGSNAGEVGDVETAGETTAADTISSPPDTRPVGADTLVKVADTPKPAEDVGD